MPPWICIVRMTEPKITFRFLVLEEDEEVVPQDRGCRVKQL